MNFLYNDKNTNEKNNLKSEETENEDRKSVV